MSPLLGSKVGRCETPPTTTAVGDDEAWAWGNALTAVETMEQVRSNSKDIATAGVEGIFFVKSTGFS